MFSGDFLLSPFSVNYSCYSSAEDVFLSILYTVEKFAAFSYEIFYVLLNCGGKCYQCKSEIKPGTTFGHIAFTAAYFYQRRTPTLNIF
jgi:hypothetical protein